MPTTVTLTTISMWFLIEVLLLLLLTACSTKHACWAYSNEHANHETYMCPPNFYANLKEDSPEMLRAGKIPHPLPLPSREGSLRPQPKICQYCPHISCFIVRGVQEDVGDKKVMSCRRKNNLPNADDVILYLDCILTGDDREHLNLFIYYPRPFLRSIRVDCIEKNFLEWLKDDHLSISALELGFKMTDLTYPSMLIEYSDILKNLKFLVITPHSDIEKFTLSRINGTMENTTIIFRESLTGEEKPSTRNLPECAIRPKVILFMKECYFNTTSENFDVVTSKQTDRKSEFCTFHNPTQPPDHDDPDILLHELPVHFEAVAGIILVSVLALVIGIFIAFYYIRNHSRFSAKKRQQRLEKKRAIDAYIKQSYSLQNKAVFIT